MVAVTARGFAPSASTRPSGIGHSVTRRVGSVIATRSPSRSAVRIPLNVSNAIDAVVGTRPTSHSACAEASVAWPHRPTSTVGVNQRRPNAFGARHHERRLGEVHLRSDVLHPVRVGRLLEQADTGGVAAEGAAGKGIDLKNRDAHASTE